MSHERVSDGVRRSADERHLRQSDERTLARRALDLQQLVGNSAVTALVARAPLQRDTKPKPPAGKEERGGGYTLTIDGLGSIAVESLSFGRTHTGTFGAGAGEAKKPPGPPQDVVFTVKTGKLSVKLMEYASRGEEIKQATVVMKKGGATFTMVLKGVNVSSFQTGGDGGELLDTFTLTATEVEHKLEEKGGGAGPKAEPPPPARRDY